MTYNPKRDKEYWKAVLNLLRQKEACLNTLSFKYLNNKWGSDLSLEQKIAALENNGLINNGRAIKINKLNKALTVKVIEGLKEYLKGVEETLTYLPDNEIGNKLREVVNNNLRVKDNISALEQINNYVSGKNCSIDLKNSVKDLLINYGLISERDWKDKNYCSKRDYRPVNPELIDQYKLVFKIGENILS
jgi:hypothetical protein